MCVRRGVNGVHASLCVHVCVCVSVSVCVCVCVCARVRAHTYAKVHAHASSTVHSFACQATKAMTLRAGRLQFAPQPTLSNCKSGNSIQLQPCHMPGTMGLVLRLVGPVSI